MSMNLGINVVEVDGATPSLQGAATSIPGFVIRSQRGVPGVVRQVSSFTQFVDYFGGYVDSKDANGVQTANVGAYALRGFFDNGGAMAYVMRLVDAGVATAATHSFPSDPSGTSLVVTAAFRGQSDPGTWGNNLGIKIAANPDVPSAFDLTVARLNAAGGVATVLETWTKLKIGGGAGLRKPEAINDPKTGSKFIKVAVSGGTANPAAIDFTALAGGAEDALSGDALDTALINAIGASSLFDTLPISLLAIPESSSPGVVGQALTYCANRGDCMFVGHVPDGMTPSAAKGYGKGRQAEKRYGALYYPYIQVIDPIGTLIWIPPTGHVLGVYARTDQQRGLWKAPAGTGALVNDAIDVRTRISDTDHTDLVKNGSVNAIRPIAGAGIIIDSSRTLSTSPLWLYVNVRLLFNYVESSLRDGLRWVVQEPNDATLWNKVKFNSVVPFLAGLWRRGAFGPGGPDDVFRVKIDAENNPPDSIQQGVLNVEVYFYPSRPAETIVITVGQKEGGASITERR